MSQMLGSDVTPSQAKRLRRDGLLGGVAEAARLLLAIEDFEAVVHGALDAIATAADVDRIYIVEHRIDQKTGQNRAICSYEWGAPGIVQTQDMLGQFPRNLDELGTWFDRLKTGEAVQSSCKTVSKTVPESAQRITSLDKTVSRLVIPIFVDSLCWGSIGFDDCTPERLWSEAEIAALKTVAACIGSAIERDRTRQEREATAQARAAELEAANAVLRTRDRLLNSVNAATRCLVANEDLETALPTMLQILGEGTEQCRAYILRNSRDEHTGELLFNLMLEWDAPHIPAKMDVGAQFPIPVEHFPDHLTAPLKAGRATQFLASELDGLSPAERDPGQVLSMVGVPITVRDEWWGLLGLDDCIEERVWSDAEIAVLETAAATIGGAIERDRSRQAREAAEKTVLEERERAAQERAAELAKANEAISQSLNALVTKPQLSEFLGQLLLATAQQIGACAAHLLLYDEQTNTLNLQVSIEHDRVYMGPSPMAPPVLQQPVPADITSGWEIVGNAQQVVIVDENSPFDESFWWPGVMEWHRSQGHIAVACIPMKAGNQALGVMGFSFRDRTVLTDEQVAFMQALTNQAIVAIQLTRLAEQARTNALTDERNRLAREIHDTLAQAFTGVSLQLEAAKGCLSHPNDAKRFIDNAGQLARRGLSEARRSVHALRSHALETDSLVEALHTALVEMTQGSPIQTSFQLEGVPFSLPEDIKINLLRIGQEAITNTLRHAQAQNLTLTLYFAAREIRITISDDGNGCQIDSLADVEGFGLLGMHERALRFEGQFYFTSTLGQGTEIDIIIPIEHGQTL